MHLSTNQQDDKDLTEAKKDDIKCEQVDALVVSDWHALAKALPEPEARELTSAIEIEHELGLISALKMEHSCTTRSGMYSRTEVDDYLDSLCADVTEAQKDEIWKELRVDISLDDCECCEDVFTKEVQHAVEHLAPELLV